MKIKTPSLPALGLLAALATAALTAPYPQSARSEGSAAPVSSDTNLQLAVAQKATAGWFNDQSDSNDYRSTSALNETDATLATYAEGLTIDSIHDDANGYDFSDDARLVIANNVLSSNLFGIPPTAGLSGFGLTDSFLREIERAPGPEGRSRTH